MKKSLIGAAILLAAALVCTALANEPTNSSSYLPFPPPFREMTNDSIMPPGMKLVAIYACKGTNLIMYSCVGTMYRPDTQTAEVILPEHLFAKGISTNIYYAVRVMQPDSGKIDGYLDKIVMTGTNLANLDVAIARIGMKPTIIPAYIEPRKRIPSTMYPSRRIMMGGMQVARVKSLITGKVSPALGYGVTFATDADMLTMTPEREMAILKSLEKNSSLMIGLKSNGGDSGTPYMDDHGRLFILSSGLEETVDTKLVIIDSQQGKGVITRPINGPTSLVGPLQLIPQ
jgi:hypothetical protein